MKLTEAEREALRGWWCEGSSPAVLAAMDAAVEAILAARLAKVEALAEEWKRGGDRLIERNQDRRSPAGQQRWVEGYAMRRAASALRAALDADARRGESVMSEQTPSAENDAPRIIPIPDVECQNCGAGLAWRVGVGRYVISHANGDDVCSHATVRLADEDREAASRAYRKADEEFAARRIIPPASSAQPDEPGEGEER